MIDNIIPHNFNENLKNKLEKKLIEINRIIVHESNLLKNEGFDHIGIFSGISGIALYHFYYSRFTKSQNSYEYGMELIFKCIEKINGGYNFPTYCTGISGFGWFLEHLKKEKFVSSDGENIVSNFDNYLYKIMIQDLSRKNYDLLHGALGYGYYFLERYNNTSKVEMKIKYKNHLLEIIEKLGVISQEDTNGVKWLSEIDLKNTEAFSLGLAHGMSSLIIFFSKLHNIKEFKNKVKPLLTDSISYLLSKKINNEKSISLYPSIIQKNGKNIINSRLSWCYGDLGIGIALLSASESLKDEELKEEAINILLHTTKRKNLLENSVYDSSLCHGAFGIAQIYQRLYRDTNIIDFKMSMEYWMEQGLKLANHFDGYAGFMQFEPNNDKENEWKKYLTLLVGLSGIGLVIISFLSDRDNNWDECLIIN